ncbi:cupin domain-containing protein [Pseudomonas soli]|uniref:Cupin domain-containing protein n=1 Tax=Pseudomonas soli TaxID=1306993 RepID=A0AAJ5MI07_9PSED|nr:cupin domain-containing protein [Pseudomonas soli]MDW9404527.1 cupin domain-containing protein [Pseudomonas soli]PYC41759.1 cupin [Pseudomonas soli]UXZ43980.1 cupin domain-containing protein [Pseudomonas soli]
MHTVPITRLSRSFATSYFDAQTAHEGQGTVLTSRVVPSPEWGCNFIDLVALLPEATIGMHEHTMEDSEIYIVISGDGEMTLADKVFKVEQGCVLINPPGGRHALRNIGRSLLKLVVLDMPSPSGKENER